jgi:hypothetical protein
MSNSNNNNAGPNLKAFTLKEGDVVYHGTSSKNLIPNGMPSIGTGNWFTMSKKQAVLFALAKFGKNTNGRPLIYTYRVKAPAKLVFLENKNNMVHFARSNNIGIRNMKQYNYSGINNRRLAMLLCTNPRLRQGAGFAGWRFPSGQDQVMLCNPKRFLELTKAEFIDPRNSKTPIMKITNNSSMVVNANNNSKWVLRNN